MTEHEAVGDDTIGVGAEEQTTTGDANAGEEDKTEDTGKER